jgi:hypothetical protein
MHFSRMGDKREKSPQLLQIMPNGAGKIMLWGSGQAAIIRCPKCGHDIYVSASDLKDENACPKCKRSFTISSDWVLDKEAEND